MKKKANLIISMTDISDAININDELSTVQNDFLPAMCQHAKEIVKRGGIITIEQKYTNAKKDILKFSTEQEVEEWCSKLYKAKNILEKIAWE
jgi:hypothetical protein